MVNFPSVASIQPKMRTAAGGLLLNPFISRMLEGLVSQERAVSSATQFSFEAYLLTFLQMNTFECNNYESIEQLHPDEFGPWLE